MYIHNITRLKHMKMKMVNDIILLQSTSRLRNIGLHLCRGAAKFDEKALTEQDQK
jgi:hypothetical protein